MALTEDCRTQARLDVITRTNSYQVRTGDYGDDTISVYLVVRRYWGDRPKLSFEAAFEDLTQRAEAMCNTYVVPRILRPISQAIASKS